MTRPHLLSFFVLLALASVLGQTWPTFDCPKLPKMPAATNINELRPQDINVVMGLGDSISAGFCMHCLPAWDLLDLVEYRGDVFMMGGNPGALTIPNFLSNYNPNIQGASIGNSLPLDAIYWKNHIVQPWDAKVTHLNGAQSEAKVEALPSQVSYIYSQLKTTYNETVDFENDWKMMTILIGANNLCGACVGRSYAEPDYYQLQLNITLTQIYETIPRTFVNILPMFNISQVWDFASKSAYCSFMWKDIVKSECQCLQGDATPEDRTTMDVYAMAYREKIEELAEFWQSLNSTTFTVKVQPCIQDLIVEGINDLSEFDCFHPSALADAAFTIGLWNNLMVPQDEKQTNVNYNTTILCPTVDTFLH